MKRHYRHFLEDIIENCDKAQEFTGNVKFEHFMEDEKTFYATVRALEIVGEAINHIPDEIRLSYPEIPWHKIVGFRNMVIHEYFSIDRELVWNTARINTIFLKEQTSIIMKNMGNDV